MSVTVRGQRPWVRPFAQVRAINHIPHSLSLPQFSLTHSLTHLLTHWLTHSCIGSPFLHHWLHQSLTLSLARLLAESLLSTHFIGCITEESANACPLVATNTGSTTSGRGEGEPAERGNSRQGEVRG